MCLAVAYYVRNGEPELIMEDVETVRAGEGNVWDLIGVFGDQKRITARVKRLRLLESRLFFEEPPGSDQRF
jgi:predicted RNA-binding protein